jgi:signal transduction histidine kinase
LAERLRIARRVEGTAMVALVGLCALLPFRSDVTWVDYTLYPGIALLLGFMYLTRPRFPGVAGAVAGVGFILLVTVAAWFREGFSSGVTSGAYALAVVVGGLLWGRGKTLLLAALASMAAMILAWHAPSPAHAPLRSWGEVTAILVTLGLFVELALSALSSRIAEAQASRRRFQQLFDGSPDGLILVDKSGKIEILNRAAHTLMKGTGTVGAQLTECSPFVGTAATLVKKVLEEKPNASALGVDLNVTSEDHYLSLDQQRFHTLTATPLGDDPESLPNQWLFTVRDVTDLVLANRSRQTFEAQLARSKSLEALGRLAGGVAHDFNNLLTVILGTTDLVLESPELNPSARSDLRSVQSSAERAAELTRQLLAFGRKQVLEPVVFCPNDSIEQLHSLFERLIPSNINLRVATNPDLGHARIDPARLEQVLINLVTNARDAMKDGGDLTIETYNYTQEAPGALLESHGEHEVIQPGQYVLISVKDTGTGMDATTQSQIFEPFFTTKELGKGTGLGLATVLGIVRQSGGHIRVHSDVGVGTRFELLFLRANPEDIAQQQREPDSFNRPAPRKLRVLLVEDNRAVRTSVAAMLDAAGHAVVEAESGEHALAIVAQWQSKFDLLLTDVIMPNINGQQLALSVHELHPHLPVLYMTGYTQGTLEGSDGQTKGILGSGISYIPKPFTRRLLEQKLAELLGHAK